MTESPVDEVARILATWPESERLAGVLRVVRSLVSERDARVTLAQAVLWVESMQMIASGAAVVAAENAASTHKLAEMIGDLPLPASLLAALANEEKARGEGPRTSARSDVPVSHATAPVAPPPEPLLALAEEAMPIIRPEGFVQFGPSCAIHADKIASTASPIIRKAFLAWMESVERYHAAYDAAREAQAKPVPLAAPAHVIDERDPKHWTGLNLRRNRTYSLAEVEALLAGLRDRIADDMHRRAESNMRLSASINGQYWHERETDAQAYFCAEEGVRKTELWPTEPTAPNGGGAK